MNLKIRLIIMMLDSEFGMNLIIRLIIMTLDLSFCARGSTCGSQFNYQLLCLEI